MKNQYGISLMALASTLTAKSINTATMTLNWSTYESNPIDPQRKKNHDHHKNLDH
ncbi:hypothetical protein ACF8FB_01005 [Pseudomonas sp. yb_2]|uniref:hypothetical protein n=1 Tax=Pseudomonas sp. yb_2 TaxID=3367218 RepID=UPI00370AE5E3